MLCIGGAVLLVASSRLSGFALIGDSWPAGTEIVMHLSLSRAATGFQDGSASWNASAADALRIWNEHLGTVRFVEAGSVASKNGDGVNSVFFSSSVYGEKFGTNTIAVTVGFNDATNPAIIVETDVIFNTAERWNSYRGPVQFDSSGKPIYDLKRVALHEFGHVLGLDHPDKKGQPDAHALMNSAYGDNDALTDDDIAGAQHLFGGRPAGGGFGRLLRTLNLQVDRLAADPVRPRVYATMGGTNSVAVIDIDTLAVIKTIPVGERPFGLSVSVDGSKLWVANRGSASAAIGVIDLNTLEALPSLAGPQPAYDVEEGINGRLYATAPSYPGQLMQIDSRTGAATLFGWMGNHTGFLEITRDRRTLFYGDHRGGTIEKFDVSSSTPVQVKYEWQRSSNSMDLALSSDGSFLLFPGGGGTPGFSYSTAKIAASDLSISANAFQSGPYPGVIAISGDDAVVYLAVSTGSNRIISFNAETFAETGSVELGTDLSHGDLVVDRTGAYLFMAANSYNGPVETRVYATGRTNVRRALPAAPKTLVNVSTRLRSEAGEDALIGGFIISGIEPKTVVVRAIGPSLPVLDRLEDPSLTLHDGNGEIAKNDDWITDSAAVLETELSPQNERESVIVRTLQPGAYTAVVRGSRAETGVALVEVYDLTAANSSTLANISTRGKVETGDNVMIGGFIIGGGETTRVIVRAIGPSLRGSNVPGALADTTLDLHDGNGALLASNDDWRIGQEAEIVATTIPPSDDLEAAVVQNLQPGNYTAVVRGKAESSGVALIEVYNLDGN